MEAREAVELAKSYVVEMFDAEPIKEVGLEEVELQGGSWLVTIGFTRVWPASSGVLRTLGGSVPDLQAVAHRRQNRVGSVLTASRR